MVRFQRLRFWLGPTALFTTQPKTQKRAYQCIFGSHDTIHTFKNYFTIVFSTIVFSFLQISNVQIHPMCAFSSSLKNQLILLFSLFLLLFMTPFYFLILFMGSTVLFQLTFTFIYNTFSKNFSISAK